MAKFKLKLKKTRKNTRPARYDLYQIPFEFVVAVMNRFKGLDLINNVPEELWTEIQTIVQEVVTKTIAQKNRCKKAVWLSEEALQATEHICSHGKAY